MLSKPGEWLSAFGHGAGWSAGFYHPSQPRDARTGPGCPGGYRGARWQPERVHGMFGMALIPTENFTLRETRKLYHVFMVSFLLQFYSKLNLRSLFKLKIRHVFMFLNSVSPE